LIIIPHPPTRTPLPYTTLFRSSTRTGRRKRTPSYHRMGRATGPATRSPTSGDAVVVGVDGAGPRPVRLHRPRRQREDLAVAVLVDRKSTRLNSSHQIISYAVFC